MPAQPWRQSGLAMEVDNDDVEGAFFSLCSRSGNGKKRSKGCATEAEVTTTNNGGWYTFAR